MPLCPCCGAEFEEGAYSCANCGAWLQDGNTASEQARSEIELIEIEVEDEAATGETIVELLHQHGISCALKKQMDFSHHLFGQESESSHFAVLVGKNSAEAAAKLIQEFLQNLAEGPEADPERIVCPHCGELLPADSACCPKCGGDTKVD